MEPNNLPQTIYQSVDIDISIQNENLSGETTLWLFYRAPIGMNDTIRLHSRFHQISEVKVNGIPAKFMRKDGLKNFMIEKKKPQTANEMDLLFRSALEIARAGELEIQIPDLSESKFAPAKLIPKSAHKDVAQRYEKIYEAYNNLSSVKDYGGGVEERLSSSSAAATATATNVPAARKTLTFLQVYIKYSLSNNSDSNALCFRRAPAFVNALRDHLSGHANATNSNSSGGGNKAVPAPQQQVRAVYPTSTSNSLYDVDGVRCWLPCIDSSDQRLVFDFSLSIARGFHVSAGGHRLAAVRQPGQLKPKTGRVVHRFFTAQRVPVSQLGFFAGRVESYRQSLYQAKTRVWVAKGLSDYALQDTTATSSAGADESAAMPPVGGTMGISAAASMPPTRGRSGSFGHENSASNDPRVKRALESFISRDQQKDGANSAVKANKEEHSTKKARKDEAGNSFAMPAPLPTHHKDNKEDEEEQRRVWFDQVHHTLLAFDLSTRIIHKFTGHKLPTEELTIVFVPDLGSQYIVSNGLILVDVLVLHGNDRVYAEGAMNQLLLEAYLYSWLRSTVPIAWAGLDWLIHGLVGYLLLFYLEEVYGEEEGQYALQKTKDTVLELQKAGFPGATCLIPLVPEGGHVYHPAVNEIAKAKATLLFVFLENKIGGRDAMRLALRELIKAPLLFAQTKLTSMPKQFMSNSADQTPVSPSLPVTSPVSLTSEGSPSPLIYGSEQYQQGTGTGLGGETPYRSALTPASMQHAMGAGGYQSPFIHQGGETSPYVSAYSRMMGSHYSRQGIGEASPRSPFRLQGLGHPLMLRGRSGTGLGDTSPLSSSLSPVSMNRQHSITNNAGWALNVDTLRREVFTAEDFIGLLHLVSDAYAEFGVDLVDRLFNSDPSSASSNPVALGSLSVSVNSRTAKQKKIVAITEFIGFDHAANVDRRKVSNSAMIVPLMIVEEMDNNVSRAAVTFADGRQVYEQAGFARPGRRRQKIIVGKDSSGNRTHTPSSLEMVKEADYPVRYAVLDPIETLFVDVLVTSNDFLLIEQLYADYRKELGPGGGAGAASMHDRRVLLRVQALRSIGRAPITAADTHLATASSQQAKSATTVGTTAGKEEESAGSSLGIPERSGERQVRALQEVLLNSTRDGRQLDFHSVQLRAEAAWALATWQNTHAPQQVSQGDNTNTAENGNHWQAMEAMIEGLLELFWDGEASRPLPLNPSDEGSRYLRSSMLMALSTIRSQRGHTPQEVTEALLIFAEYELDPASIEQQMDVDPDSSIGQQKQQQSSSQQCDDSHYQASLLLALSRVRFQKIDLADVNHPIRSILRLSRLVIERAFGEARVAARIAWDRERAHHSHRSSTERLPLPQLASNGLAVAAAITCSMEMDLQTMIALARGRAKAAPSSIASSSNEQRQPLQFAQLRSSRTKPPARGIISGLAYHRFFAAPERVFYCLDKDTSNDFDDQLYHSQNTFQAQYQYFLCSTSAVVRAAAYEAYCRLCLGSHVAVAELIRLDASSGSNRSANSGPLFFGAAAVEALSLVLEHEQSSFVRQDAAASFLEAVSERPARVVRAALSMGRIQLSMGSHDPLAFTIIGRSQQGSSDFNDQLSGILSQVLHEPGEAAAALRVIGQPMSTALSTWTKMICRSTAGAQVIRNSLLTAWLTVFGGDRRPPTAAVLNDVALAEHELVFGSRLLKVIEGEVSLKELDPLRLVGRGAVTPAPLLEEAQRLGVKKFIEERRRGQQMAARQQQQLQQQPAAQSIPQSSATTGMKITLGRPPAATSAPPAFTMAKPTVSAPVALPAVVPTVQAQPNNAEEGATAASPAFKLVLK